MRQVDQDQKNTGTLYVDKRLLGTLHVVAETEFRLDSADSELVGNRLGKAPIHQASKAVATNVGVVSLVPLPLCILLVLEWESVDFAWQGHWLAYWL